MEFGNSSGGVMTALAILLGISSSGGGRGGGDFHYHDPLVGSWAGDRIAIIGDYAEPEDVPGFTDVGDTPWVNEENWHDISEQMRHLIEQDGMYEFEINEQKLVDQEGNVIRTWESVQRKSKYGEE